MAGTRLALRVEAQQLLGHVAHGLLDAPLDLLPAAAAETIHVRPRPLGPCVALHAVEGVDGDLELVAPFVGDDHELHSGAADIQRLEPLEASDAVVGVDDEVADLEVPEIGPEAVRPSTAAPLT